MFVGVGCIFFCLIRLAPCSLNADFDGNEKNFEMCLNKIISGLFGKTNTILYVHNNNFERFATNDNPKVLLEINQRVNLNNSRLLNYVILTKDAVELNAILLKLKASSVWQGYNNNRNKFLVITDNSTPKEVYTVLWLHEINSAIILTNKLQIYSDYPYFIANNCGNEPHPKLLDNCANVDNVILPKISNFNGCVIKAMYDVIYRKMPYNGNPNSSKPGLYIQPLKEIGKKLNITFVFEKQPPKPSLEYADNLTTHESERILYSREQDMFIALTNRIIHYYEHFELSDIVHQEPQIWVLPKPKRINNMEILFMTFKPIAWGIIIAIFLCVAFFWCTIAKIIDGNIWKNTTRSLMAIFAITFNSSLHILPKSHSLNVLFLIYVIYCFHVNFYFQGSLSSLLIKPLYEDRITTEEELANSNVIPIINKHKTIYLLEQQNTIATKLALKSRPHNGQIPENIVDYVYKNDNITTTSFSSVLLLESNYDLKIDYIEAHLVLSMEAVYVFRKGYPLVPIINRYVKILQEGGFFVKWLNDMKILKVSEASDPIVILTMSHLESPFVILICGLVFGLFIFVIEFFIRGRFSCR